MLVLSAKRNEARLQVTGYTAARLRTTSAVTAMLRQDRFMSGVKKERWAEAEVLALPAGEHDYFERKSGAILSDPNFRQDVAKAVCAMANSGGGHVILGIGDNSVIDGVPLTKGAISTRDWIEQITPHLLSYPLEDFRVHEVEPATRSTIPAGTVVIVVDVGDSVLAPHQTAGTRTYYYREDYTRSGRTST